MAVAHGGASGELAVDLLPRCLERAAASDRGVRFPAPGRPDERLSYGDLHAEAEAVARGLVGVTPELGAPVLLQLPTVRDFLVGFWACSLARRLPVPLAFAAGGGDSRRATRALANAAEACGSPVVLTREGAAEALAERAAREGVALRPVTLEACRSEENPAPLSDGGDPRDPALLLFTSGSTGAPKGVILSHGNVLASVAGSARVNGFTEREVSLNWLPLSHIGALMRSLRETYLGCDQVQAPTDPVLAEPLLWLDWIDAHRVTTTWAPNFAFGLVASRIAAAPERRWDLSSLRSLWTSGEAIAPKTMFRFLDLLEPHGLDIGAMHTAWGMTEACFATFSHVYLRELRAGRARIPEVGRPIPGVSLRIVGDDDEPLPEGREGHLQIRGDVPTSRYLQDEANRESFTSDGWLRTGDRGYLADGRLTVTGRQKDVIIIRGENYAAREIEAVVDEIDGVEPSYTAACAVRGPAGEDALAVFFVAADGDGDLAARIARRIRRDLARELGLSPLHVLAVEKEDIPKTGVGKIQRDVLRRRLAAGELSGAIERSRRLAAGPEPESPAERRVAELFARALGRPVEEIGLEDDLFALGGSSVEVARVASELARELPELAAPAAELYRSPRVRDLARLLEGAAEAGAGSGAGPGAEGSGDEAAAGVAGGPARRGAAGRRRRRVEGRGRG